MRFAIFTNIWMWNVNHNAWAYSGWDFSLASSWGQKFIMMIFFIFKIQIPTFQLNLTRSFLQARKNKQTAWRDIFLILRMDLMTNLAVVLLRIEK